MKHARQSRHLRGLFPLLVLLASAQAQEPTPTPAPPAAAPDASASPAAPAAPAAAASVTLPANAAVPMRFLTTVSSGTHERGQKFELEVTDNITAGDQVVIPAGAIATGEVVHADRARGLGKAGELILAARFVTVGDRQIKLRGQLSMTGQDKTLQALYLVPWIKGKNLEVPVDTEVIGRTIANEIFSVSAPSH